MSNAFHLSTKINHRYFNTSFILITDLQSVFSISVFFIRKLLSSIKDFPVNFKDKKYYYL